MESSISQDTRWYHLRKNLNLHAFCLQLDEGVLTFRESLNLPKQPYKNDELSKTVFKDWSDIPRYGTRDWQSSQRYPHS